MTMSGSDRMLNKVPQNQEVQLEETAKQMKEYSHIPEK